MASAARPRKIVAVLTDEEWRELRVRAIEDDTTLQGLVTTMLLGALQDRRRGGGSHAAGS